MTPENSLDLTTWARTVTDGIASLHTDLEKTNTKLDQVKESIHQLKLDNVEKLSVVRQGVAGLNQKVEVISKDVDNTKGAADAVIDLTAAVKKLPELCNKTNSSSGWPTSAYGWVVLAMMIAALLGTASTYLLPDNKALQQIKSQQVQNQKMIEDLTATLKTVKGLKPNAP